MPLDPRHYRTSLVPGGYTIRLAAMVGVLILIGFTIYQMRERALAAKRAAQGAGTPAVQNELSPRVQPVAPASEPSVAHWKETVVEGPADDEPVEMDKARMEFEAVEDKVPLMQFEMFAYWRLMKWARSRSFAELEERAHRDVPFTTLWQAPENHRGELIKLRLHVRRVMKWTGKDVAKNPVGIKTTYEISGTTDASHSFPYLVVCSELPPGIPVGENINNIDADFVGYFLKIMEYQDGLAKLRGTPLLMGRVRKASGGMAKAPSGPSAGLGLMLAMGAMAMGAAAIFGTMFWRLSRQSRRPEMVPTHTSRPSAEVEGWLENFPNSEAAPSPLEVLEHSTAAATNGEAHHDPVPTNPELGDGTEL